MSAPLLSVAGVTKSFRDAVAVDALSFEVRRGEIFGFLGPNGAGKTTTLRMILGITRPDRGEVRFDGAPGVDRGRIGYLPEERGLYDDQRVLDTLA
jgi:ABC-2 type transport system ATP-binding protein